MTLEILLKNRRMKFPRKNITCGSLNFLGNSATGDKIFLGKYPNNGWGGGGTDFQGGVNKNISWETCYRQAIIFIFQGTPGL